MFTTVYFKVLLIIVSLSGAALHKYIYICKIQKLQNRGARFLAQEIYWNIRDIDIVRDLGWQNVKERNCFLSCCLTYKSLNNPAPYYLSVLFSSVSEYHTVSIRNEAGNTLQQPRCNNYLYKSSLTS